MRPKERRDSGQNDLFKARLDQIVDMNHALAKLAQAVNWGFLEKSFGAVYADGITERNVANVLRWRLGPLGLQEGFR